MYNYILYNKIYIYITHTYIYVCIILWVSRKMGHPNSIGKSSPIEIP